LAILLDCSNIPFEANDEMLKKKRDGLLRIAIVGPECTGKSELAEYLANHFGSAWVEEYARTYLDTLERPYDEADLLKIAQGQISLEDNLAAESAQVLICDTNLLVIKIWSEFKYSRCDQKILDLIDSRTYDLHFLTDIDIPWEADKQREHPDRREELFEIYERELQSRKLSYIKISGSREERRRLAIKSIAALLTENE